MMTSTLANRKVLGGRFLDVPASSFRGQLFRTCEKRWY